MPTQTSRSNAAPLIPEEVRRFNKNRPAAQLARVKAALPRYKPPGRRKRIASNGRFA